VQNQEDNFNAADFLFMYNENLDPRENWFGSPHFLLLPKPQQTLRLIQWTRFEAENGCLSQLFFNGFIIEGQRYDSLGYHGFIRAVDSIRVRTAGSTKEDSRDDL